MFDDDELSLPNDAEPLTMFDRAVAVFLGIALVAILAIYMGVL